MVESDKRKSVFLRTAIRELGLSNAKVINARIEGAQIPISDIVSARALAPLTDLFTLSQGFADQNTTFLFQKGKTGLRKSKQLRIIGLLNTMRLKVKLIAMR